MDGRYAEVCEVVMRYKEHRDPLVRKTVVLMIPDLAHFDPDQFVSAHLSSSMAYLLSQLKKEKERSPGMYSRNCHYIFLAFVAIGKVAIAVGRHIAQYLDSLLQSIKETLIAKG